MIKILFILFFSIGSIQLFADKKEAAVSPMNENTKIEFDYAFMEGVRYKILGNFKSALACFDRCMKLYDSSAAVRYELASILILTDNLDIPLQLIREAVQLEPGNMWYRLLQANVLQKKSMIDEACQVYDELILQYPEREDFYFIQVELFNSVEKWEKAIMVLDRHEKQFGLSEMVSLEKAKLYNKLNDLKRASAEIVKLINKYPGQSDYLSLLAELYLSNNKEKKGLQVLNKLIKKDSSNGLVLFYLTDYYIEKGDTLNADIYLRRALLNDRNDNNSKVQYILKLAVNQDKFHVSDEKIKLYVQLLVCKYKDDLSVRTLNANLLRREKKLGQSVKELEYIISKKKTDFLIWEELLLTYNELGDTTSMQRCAMECIQYFPNEPLPYMMISFPFFMKQDYTKALSYLKKGISLAADNSPLKFQFYASLGDIYYALDSVELSFSMYDKALEINPKDPYVLNNYAYYLALREERLNDAERMSSMAINIDSDNATFMDTYAWVLFKKKDYSLAKFCMKTAIEKSTNPSGVLYEHYGDILYMNGEKDEAVKMWKKALELKDSECVDLKNKIENGLIIK